MEGIDLKQCFEALKPRRWRQKNYTGESILRKEFKYGIAICGSGIGISIALNRVRGVRAALCYDIEMARLARQHNDANVIVFGARFINYETAINLLDVFDKEKFEGGRHIPRVNKLG